MKKLILASGSPRRKEILGNLNLDFEVLVSNAEEKSPEDNIPVGIYVQELALFKASGVCNNLQKKNAIIIAADTVVYLDGEILGKPKDKEDAFLMLKNLSGKKHSVFTGICVMDSKTAKSVCSAVETSVFFRDLSNEEIESYVASGEPMDKAGAYGIQGLGALLVDKIEGDYLNVVGLPVNKLSQILKDEFDYDIFKENCGNEI